MGYEKHNSIIITSDTPIESKFGLVYKKALEIFKELVSGIVESKLNGYVSFFIAPDGSKDGWKESNDFDEKRKELCDYIDTMADEDGYNCIRYVDVWYDEAGAAGIERKNAEVTDGEE